MESLKNEELVILSDINYKLYDKIYMHLPESRWDFVLMASIDVIDKIVYTEDRFAESHIAEQFASYNAK